MVDFDYGNTRLRVHMTELLKEHTLIKLAQSDSVSSFMAGLLKTPYRKAVERAQIQMDGRYSLESVFSEEVKSAVSQLLSYYERSALKQIKILLSYQDLQNHKIILRGIQKGAPKEEIHNSFVHWGLTPPAFLKEVAASKNMDEALARLTILGCNVSKALLALTPEQLIHSAEVDYALERWFFKDFLKEQAENTSPQLLTYFRKQADIKDILTISAIFLFPKLFVGKEISEYLIGEGDIPFRILIQSCSSSSLKQAILKLRWTPYFGSLRFILEENSSVDLSIIHKKLQDFALGWINRQIHRDPLGISVPIGFIHNKQREVGCLRFIAHGIQLGLQPVCMLENLEMVA